MNGTNNTHAKDIDGDGSVTYDEMFRKIKECHSTNTALAAKSSLDLADVQKRIGEYLAANHITLKQLFDSHADKRTYEGSRARRDLVEQRFDELESVLSSGFVDIIFSNEEEARVVATRVDFDAAEGGATDDPELMRAITYLTDACPTLAVVSLGARGCLVASRRNGVPPTFVRTVPVRRLVDSVGCGDAFTAGILWATVQGADPIRAIKVGTACGAAAATSRGSEVDDAAMEVVRWVADGRVARSTFAAASS